MTTCELDRQLHTSVLKREAIKEKAFREERERQDEEANQAYLGMGGSEMSKKELKKIVDGDRRMYYRTEELNDKLYIHYKGWRDLKNLDGWTGLKTIYAECNAFSRIAGLATCTKLRSLFLQENCINKISGLETLTDLWSLNLGSNFIERIEGLENCKDLNTLILSKNKIGFGGLEDIEALVNTNVCSLDIQDNRLDDPDILPEVLMQMPALRVLYLKGNPAAKKIVNYRKSITVYCKDLRYLDDRPVFEDDRRTAEAFNRGGLEEQRAETKLIREEKNEKHDRNMRQFTEMVENCRREKKERDAMRAEDKFTDETDPVESFERRAKRLNDKWREENADDLKDDARERAEKCLANEREGKRREGEQVDDKQKATTASRDTGDTGGSGDTATGSLPAGDTGAAVDSCGQPVGVDSCGQPVEVGGKPVDNRKLVYDDIWDDAPVAQPKKAEDKRKLVYEDIFDNAPTPSASATSGPAGPPVSLGPAAGAAKGAEGVFLPWAEGAVGMDALAPSKEVLEKHKATRAAQAEANAKLALEPEEKSTQSWHSRYLKEMAKTQGKIETAKQQASAFKPPPRNVTGWLEKSEPAATTGSDVTGWLEKSKAAATTGSKTAVASPEDGAGELDEMD